MTTVDELLHFAVLDIFQFILFNSIWLLCHTNNPCHLTCYYTSIEPRRHKTSRILRGETMLAGAYWCFDAWKTLEQQEEGDTFIHTFQVPDWSFCQTNWFTFRGTVDNILSPSAGPIFRKHHPGATPEQKFEALEEPAQDYSNIFWPHFNAQTFTPLQYHPLTKIYTRSFRAPRTYPNLYIKIKEAPNNIPTGPILSSGQTSWALLTDSYPGTWIETPMSFYILKSNVKYAIIMHTAGVGAGILRWSSRYFGITYPRGIRIYSNDAGETWSKFPLEDFLFQEWGIPPEGET